jgi:hypothetical protein
MDKERREALEWFVQFANMNLDELKPGDRAKLLIESQEYLSPKKDVDQFYPPPLDRLDQYQAYLDFLGKMAWVSGIPPRDAPEYWDTLKDLQKAVIEAFRIFDSFSRLSCDAGSAGFMWRGEIVIRTAWNRTFNLSFFPLPETLGIYTELKLYQLLIGFPCQTIQKCQGCEKYFLNASFRKKRFCSSRCMWRVNAERWREKIKRGESSEKREEYLDKQSGIMIKRYDKKRKNEGYKKTTRYQSKRSKTRKGV